jgi:hypothetical protein
MIGITYVRFCKDICHYFGYMMTSSSDYGLRAQGPRRQGVTVAYRSIFQPYAGMYVIFWYVAM